MQPNRNEGDQGFPSEYDIVDEACRRGAVEAERRAAFEQEIQRQEQRLEEELRRMRLAEAEQRGQEVAKYRSRRESMSKAQATAKKGLVEEARRRGDIEALRKPSAVERFHIYNGPNERQRTLRN